MGTSVASPVAPATTSKITPGRRLIAAGIISRRIDVRVTEAGVTGAIRKQARR
ncbi:hypothetical protein [Streptomyces sp. NPDC052192]|uniref:hypothetical protein n=1 Tax=Streptomyces sp. NPDC052192 TaxID=3155052 RepID=UPI0034170C54